MKREKAGFVRFSVYVPKSVLEFAEEHGITMNIQDFTVSAISGYLTTFASLSPDSRLPLSESREVAKSIEGVQPPQGGLCPFCQAQYLDPRTLGALASDFDGCHMVSELIKKPAAEPKAAEATALASL